MTAAAAEAAADAADAGVAVADVRARAECFGEPFFLQWNITDRCNLACSHCYRDRPAADLPLADLERVLDGFARFIEHSGRQGRVMLSGGEPMLSPHVFGLIAASRSRGLPVRVLSNGTLIDDASARALADAGVQAVQVSVEGSRAVHDSVRGQGSFDRAIAGMQALRGAGIEVTLAFTLTSANRGELPAVARLARRYAKRFHVARHVPIGRGAAMDARPLTAREMRESFEWLDAKRRAWRRSGPLVPTRDPLWHALLDAPGSCPECVSGCSVGYNGISVDADGTAYPCRRLPIALGNAAETPFEELWRHPALERLRDRDALEGRCGRCEIRWACGGCRAVAESILGHPLDEDPQCFRTVPDPEPESGAGVY